MSLETTVKELQLQNRELKNAVLEGQKAQASLAKNFNGLLEEWKKRPASGQPKPSEVFGVPSIRNGEDPLSSRGFSFLKMFGLVRGVLNQPDAKVEFGVSQKMHELMHSKLDGASQYQYGGQGLPNQARGTFLAPLAPNFFPDTLVDRNMRVEMKQLIAAGTEGANPDECLWIRRKMLSERGYDSKALSWLNELTGGALVAPPEMGELIELLRNKEALVNAGARVVPLPPQGRMVFPRQTAASNTFWVGENSPITESLIGTGEVTLQAKKLAVLIKAPNELIRFASPAAEALLRDDMTKSLALGLDLAGLEGAGSDTRPRGVINFPNITKITSSSTGPNGDPLAGRDIYRFIAAVEEANAEFEAFVMRPKTLYKYYQLRADAVGQGDQGGAFLFNLIREAQDKALPTLAGYPVVKSTQVSQVRSKGGSSNLTYIAGGMWSDMLIGMFGAIEFAATTMGDTAFINDQTWVRGILSADIAARHENAFCWMDNLDAVS
jgi:HK97 family phage major capsid protein